MMKWIKLNTPNNPTLINVSMLTQIEFLQTRGELWLWFCGCNEPVKIMTSAKSVYNQILKEIDFECHTNFSEVIEVIVENDKS